MVKNESEESKTTRTAQNDVRQPQVKADVTCLHPQTVTLSFRPVCMLDSCVSGSQHSRRLPKLHDHAAPLMILHESFATSSRAAFFVMSSCRAEGSRQYLLSRHVHALGVRHALARRAGVSHPRPSSPSRPFAPA